jgi:polyhydroxybutyrate depolymerase
MTKFVSLIGAALCLLASIPARAQDGLCGIEGPACEVSMGTYRMAMPEGDAPEGGWPALIFFHGAGGSGAGTLKNTGMVNAFLDRGYAVIAPDGSPRPNSRFGSGWSFHPGREKQRDEMAFVHEVLDDTATRFGIDRGRILMGGFSIGGSLTWYLACQDPAVAAAYVPVAGAFWRPHPVASDCAGPVRMLHTHGWRDETVPLEGRPLRNGAILQGDVFYSLGVMRELNGCTQLRADGYQTDDNYWVRWWTRCEPGTALRFALHTGGHTIPPGWAEMAIDWFEEVEGMAGNY